MIHTYRSDGPKRWSVGIYVPLFDDEIERNKNRFWEWREIRSFLSEEKAAAFTSYLNGGALDEQVAQ